MPLYGVVVVSREVRRRRRGEREKKGDTGGGRSIDPFASSSRKQVSPRKTGLIRKILIFIHTRRGGGGGGGRPGGKAFSKSPGGRKVDGGITLFYKAEPASCVYIYLCTGMLPPSERALRILLPRL